MTNKTKIVNQIINKCTNCKFYQPNKSHATLGMCLINKELNGYYYYNHFNYAEIMRSKHGKCGEEGIYFKPANINDLYTNLKM